MQQSLFRICESPTFIQCDSVYSGQNRLLKERTDFCFAKICRCQLDIVKLVNDQNFELSEHILEVCELVSDLRALSEP